MATSLIETMSVGFDLAALHDDDQAALDQLVAARLEGTPVPAEETVPPAEGVTDLIAALMASIAAREHGDATTAEKPPTTKPTRRRPADPGGPGKDADRPGKPGPRPR